MGWIIMKLLHLQYFKKVFETKNVTQAAKELFISQPALSRAIKHLENELGVPLVETLRQLFMQKNSIHMQSKH